MTRDEELARRAVELSRRVLGGTSPNPPVGAVVVDASGRVVGEGATRPPGGPHAEVVALREAGEGARGGTAVVTLEPCDHTGRTGPCTRALLEAGIARVVYLHPDPDPVAGGGAGTLRAAGVQVERLDVRAEPLEPWLAAQRLRRPFVTWKFAASLDGRSAAADGTSKWITSAEAREDVHRLRGEVDAVLAGVGTVLADDPQLTVRAGGVPRPDRRPLRVVLDSDGRTPAGARVLDGAAPTLLLTAGAPVAGAAGSGAEVAVVPRHDPAAVLAVLAARGVVSVLLEGGPTVAGAFWAAGLVDRAVGYVAPVLLGDGLAALRGAGVGTIAAAHRLRLDEVVRVGPDVRLTLRPERAEDPAFR
ncbi:bifunctional diaminohydroxyphosphoribosylaminopyrimidine deaminase/5-amino-6-(5-phosphoribosylamino)uracil reductase RibD [Kineococcus sp. NUM-3379]